MGRTLRVTTPDKITPDRPVKPVRGRAARLAAYRAQREAEAPQRPTAPVTAKPVNPTPAPTERGPIVWAKPNVYPPRDTIPYRLEP